MVLPPPSGSSPSSASAPVMSYDDILTAAKTTVGSNPPLNNGIASDVTLNEFGHLRSSFYS
jgi:hypothetical protein